MLGLVPKNITNFFIAKDSRKSSCTVKRTDIYGQRIVPSRHWLFCLLSTFLTKCMEKACRKIIELAPQLSTSCAMLSWPPLFSTYARVGTFFMFFYPWFTQARFPTAQVVVMTVCVGFARCSWPHKVQAVSPQLQLVTEGSFIALLHREAETNVKMCPKHYSWLEVSAINYWRFSFSSEQVTAKVFVYCSCSGFIFQLLVWRTPS